jgi:hypothetical protein
MLDPSLQPSTQAFGPERTDTTASRWEPPGFEVICLACEISAYAPDGDEPLF